MDELAQIEREIGNTRTVDLAKLKFPNNNRVLVKLESENPTGSHYDRIYLRLFRELETAKAIIRKRTRLIETTSGSAGRSVAHFGMLLGYDVTIVIPSGLPSPRIDAIRKYGAKIIEADGPTIRDAMIKLKRVLIDDKRRHPRPVDRYYCMNHSRDVRALKAMEGIANEVKSYLKMQPLNYFVGACGNGTSLIGVGSYLKSLYPKITIVGCEPEEACPLSFAHADAPRKPSDSFFKPHDVFGTGVPGVHFPFFDDPSSVSILDDLMVIREPERRKALAELNEMEKLDAGRSTAMCLAAVHRICEKEQNKTFLILLYDCLSKYY